jgi:hypothetical protein
MALVGYNIKGIVTRYLLKSCLNFIILIVETHNCVSRMQFTVAG